MEQKNDGGLASLAAKIYKHDCNNLLDEVARFDGMNMRDWFAGQALAGLCAASAEPHTFAYCDVEIATEKAYDYADAMLKAREPKQ